MITFFTVPKPFRGHVGTIQRNAIASWRRADPDGLVLVLGDEEGSAAAATELGVEHVSELATNEEGTPLLDDAFRRARARARTQVLCYANADILLFGDLVEAVERVAASGRPFLVVGETWDVDLAESVDFDAEGCSERLRALPAARRGADALDYFAFSTDLYEEVPPFAVGRTAFDNWLVWSARDAGALVVDASRVVRPLHQRHDYSHAGSLDEIRASAEARRNRELAGGKARLYSRFDATHALTARGLRRNLGAPFRWKERSRRAVYKLRHRLIPA